MKFLTVLLGVVVASSTFANDIGGVASRMTCAEINLMISELSAVEEPDTETVEELTKLKADYRRSCSRAARGRKTSASSRVVVVDTGDVKDKDSNESPKEVEEEQTVSSEISTEQVEDTKEDVVEIVQESGEPTEEELLEIELANLDAGLCADGTKPNKYGCCADELFKDLGNAVFACCPKEGGDCFPPIK